MVKIKIQSLKLLSKNRLITMSIVISLRSLNPLYLLHQILLKSKYFL